MPHRLARPVLGVSRALLRSVVFLLGTESADGLAILRLKRFLKGSSARSHESIINPFQFHGGQVYVSDPGQHSITTPNSSGRRSSGSDRYKRSTAVILEGRARASWCWPHFIATCLSGKAFGKPALSSPTKSGSYPTLPTGFSHDQTCQCYFGLLEIAVPRRLFRTHDADTRRAGLHVVVQLVLSHIYNPTSIPH